MSLNESSSSVVGDSEAGDEAAQIIFSPHGYFTAGVEAELGSPWSAVEPTELRFNEVLEAISVVDSDEASFTGHRRNLRKRKAIQKLPYSLDRIRHRQLLQGYDISSFDAVSEQVRLPEKPAPMKDYEPGVSASEAEGASEWQNQDSGKSDLEDTVTNTSGSDLPTISPEDERLASETARNQIMFRGKMIDVEKGYRGILPRVAWEKAMKNKSSSKVKKRRQENQDRKGLAKRKTINHRRSTQDEALMKDLIVPDDETTEVETETFNDNFMRPARLLEDVDELQKMSEYYQEKYHDELSSISSVDTQRKYGFSEVEQSTLLAGRGRKDLANTGYYDLESDPELSDTIEIAAREDNSKGIDQMLMKQKAIPSGPRKHATTTKGTKVRYRYNRAYKQEGKPKSSFKLIKRRIRRRGSSNTSTKPTDHPADKSLNDNPNEVHESIEGQEKLSDKKLKVVPFGTYPKQGSYISRAPHTFTTVVEGLSRSYAIPPTNRSEANVVDGPDDQPNLSTQERPFYLTSAIDALLSGKDIEIPDVIKVKIAKKQFILSKLRGKDIRREMMALFDHIIHHGITNTELIEVSESLTKFLLHLDNKGAYEPISEFHREFRSKVNSLRQNAKPIHFYQIAMCQFMLLEVTKYTSLSSSLKREIESEILDHIVSFFRLLAVCKEHLANVDQDHLLNSYDILNAVMRLLGAEEMLWGRLENETFPASVALILVETFPTRKAHWSILKFDHDYEAMIQILDFIQHCKKKHEWSITGDIILSIERILRRRRFKDFPSEREASESNSVTYSRDQLPVARTIFNRYLSLLRSFKLTRAFIERIMPMSELSSGDDVSVLLNRLNLLILLTEHSDLNAEKRLGELVQPITRDEYLNSMDNKTLGRICQCVLNSLLSLLEINCHKKVLFKPNGFLSIFDTLIARNDRTKKLFLQFLERLKDSSQGSTKPFSAFLKTIYPCFPVICEQQSWSKERLLLLNIYLKNLAALGPAWVHVNLFQAVQKYVEKSDSWIEHYCAIGKFLIENSVMTWWSFFIYNGVKGNLPGRLQFYLEVTQLCDAQSFAMIKRTLFETATSSFFEEKSALFNKFVTSLIDRETGRRSSFDLQTTIDSALKILESFVTVLNRLSYDDLIIKLISEIRDLYQRNVIKKGYATKVIDFLNSHFVDQVKNDHDFLALMRDLGISNEEADKNSFRDAVKLCPDPITQACYVESGLIHAAANDVSNYLGKLKSLFVFPVITNPFRFFSTLIDAHLTETLEDKFLHIKIGIAAYYLRLINEVLIARFGQVTENEFIELCRLFKIVCLRLPLCRLSKISGNRSYAFENVRFQTITLGIAQGFKEYSMLVRFTEAFLKGTYKAKASENNDLHKKIDQLVVRTAGQTLHVDFDDPRPDYEKLEKLTSLQ